MNDNLVKSEINWYNPSLVLFVGIISCAVRVLLKLGVGFEVQSPLLTGDGFHNIGDAGYAIAALFIMWIVRWKRGVLHAGENMGVMFQFFVAAILALLALYIAEQSALGLIACPSCERAVQSVFPFVPTFETHKEDPGSYLLIMAAILVSITISWFASEYHIRAGIISEYPTLITIGKETRSDMQIECSIFAGFLGEYLFGLSWIQYVFGLIVAVLILRTAWELFLEANNTFLQASIGKEFVAGITTLVESTYGIERIVKLETYPVLQAARVKVWVETRCGAESNEDIKNALRARIREFTIANGFSECRADMFFQLPDNDWHREVFAIIKSEDDCQIAPGFAHATHLRVCDVEYGKFVSGEDIATPYSITQLGLTLTEKHVRTYHAFAEVEEVRFELGLVQVKVVSPASLIPPQ